MNKKIAIKNLVAQISDHEKEEIFHSIEHIEVRPYDGMIKIRFYLSAVARMTVTAMGDELRFDAAGMPQRIAMVSDGLTALRRYMYDLDCLLADGYQQPAPKSRVTFMPNPPVHMDIPVWDEKSQKWYDAEY